MKKLITITLGFLLFSGLSFAEDVWMVRDDWDNDAITVYYLKTSTEVAKFQVNDDSITLVVSGMKQGLQEGTSDYLLGSGLTVKQLIDQIDADDETRQNTALVGNWIIESALGGCLYQTSDTLTVKALTNVTGIANKTTIDFDANACDYISFYKDAIPGTRHYLLGVRALADVPTGTLAFNLYEANSAIWDAWSMTDNTELHKYTGGMQPIAMGSINTKTEFRVYVSSFISSGYLEISGYTGR